MAETESVVTTSELVLSIEAAGALLITLGALQAFYRVGGLLPGQEIDIAPPRS